TAARANGNRTKAGRLSVVTPSRNPSSRNDDALRGRAPITRPTARYMDAVKSTVVHTSVITSAAKYGIGGKSAVAIAASHAIRSDATRRPMAYTTRQTTENSAVCASATAIWCVPNTRYTSATKIGYAGVRSTSGTN